MISNRRGGLDGSIVGAWVCAFLFLFILGGWATGCGDGGDRRVCPRCLPAPEPPAKPFTQIAPCALAAAPYTDEIARAFDVDHQRALAQGAFNAPLRWLVDPNLLEIDPGARPPTGYREQTRIEGTISLGDPVYLDRVPVTAMTQECPPEVDLPAVITLATADRAIDAAEAWGTLRIVAGSLPGAWSLTGEADLAGITGSLDLKLSPVAPQRGSLFVGVAPSPQGLRGQLSPYVVTFRDLQTAHAYDPGSDLIDGRVTAPLSGTWPGDECDYSSFPIDPAAPQPWLDGDSFAATLARQPALAVAAEPQAARWFGGPEVTVTVEVGTPTRACMGTHFGDLAFSFDVAGQLRASDGRLHTSFSRAYLVLNKGAGAQNQLSLELNLPRLASADFQARAGIEGFDTAGSPWLSGYIYASFTWDANRDAPVESMGGVDIWGEPACGTPGVQCGSHYMKDLGSEVICLAWPTPIEFPEPCGRHLR